MKPEPEWEFHVRIEQHPPRLEMRRKVDGQWQVREPTPAEAEQYEAENAW